MVNGVHSRVKLLSPERWIAVAGLEEWVREGIETNRIRYTGELASEVACAKILFPKKTEEWERKVQWQTMRQQLQSTYKVTHNYWLAIQFAIALKVIRPECDFLLEKEIREMLWKSLNRYCIIQDWDSFATHAAAMVLLAPEKKDEIPILKFWTQLMEKLDKYRNKYSRDERYGSFTRMALAMKILIAEKVSFTEQGLGFVKPTPFLPPVPPLPVIRSF